MAGQPTAIEIEFAERIAGGNRYPDRAARYGKVRKAQRQREAAERQQEKEAQRG